MEELMKNKNATALEHQSAFSLKLYKEVAKSSRDSEENVVLSPISISLLLAMLSGGAQGATLDQILSCCKLPTHTHQADEDDGAHHDFAGGVRSQVLKDGSQAGGPQLSFVSGVWVEQTMPLKAAFKQLVEHVYEAAASQADFVSKADMERETINSWVAKHTKMKIKDILPPGSLNSLTRLVLANALYFKGMWQNKFEPSDTSDGDFYLLNGDVLKVPMMHSKKKHFIQNCESFKVLKLPYSQGEDKRAFSMYIFLPYQRDGLSELQKGFDAGTIWPEISSMPKVSVGDFQLPRFKVNFGLEMIETLQKLGLDKPFSKDADFSGLVDSPEGASLFVSNVFHKGFIEVNEEGTEAAAATAAVVMLRCSLMIGPTEDFVADHPFLFLIREDITGAVIFIGHVTNPIAD